MQAEASHISDVLRCLQRSVCSEKEGLCIILKRFAYSTRYSVSDMIAFYKTLNFKMCKNKLVETYCCCWRKFLQLCVCMAVASVNKLKFLLWNQHGARDQTCFRNKFHCKERPFWHAFCCWNKKLWMKRYQVIYFVCL